MDAFISQIANGVFFGVLAIAALSFVAWCIESVWRNASQITVQHRIAAWMDEHAALEWRIAGRLHSVQIAIFWAILGGLWTALPAFQQYLTPFRFGALCVGFSLAILFARLTGQRGLPDA